MTSNAPGKICKLAREYCVWRASWWRGGLWITYIQRTTSLRPGHISPTDKLLIAYVNSSRCPPRQRCITKSKGWTNFCRWVPNSSRDISSDRKRPRQSPKQASYNQLAPNRGKKGKLKGGKVPNERSSATADSDLKNSGHPAWAQKYTSIFINLFSHFQHNDGIIIMLHL